MGLGDIANELTRIATTHGLSKDVIDLLTQKGSLLEQEILSLRQKLSHAIAETKQLELENQNLRQQLGDHNDTFEKINGILWKRTDTGYEPNPYCPKCPDHSVMMEFPPRSREMWACPDNHTFAFCKHP